MFEDSTFESGGKIKSKSGRWMIVTGIINAWHLDHDDSYPADLPRGVAQSDDADLVGCSTAATTATATATTS